MVHTGIYIIVSLWQEANVRLTQNVEIWQTPGRSEAHNSVIVRNVANLGSVAVSGMMNNLRFGQPQK